MSNENDNKLNSLAEEFDNGNLNNGANLKDNSVSANNSASAKKDGLTAFADKKEANKKATAQKNAADFKRKYFDYYDDVKDHTKGREDW